MMPSPDTEREMASSRIEVQAFAPRRVLWPSLMQSKRARRLPTAATSAFSSAPLHEAVCGHVQGNGIFAEQIRTAVSVAGCSPNNFPIHSDGMKAGVIWRNTSITSDVIRMHAGHCTTLGGSPEVGHGLDRIWQHEVGHRADAVCICADDHDVATGWRAWPRMIVLHHLEAHSKVGALAHVLQLA